ncbi:MAG TPA: dihydrodipicolinate synthase family protein, partial [Anaerolineae bacterium]|nr:dihydrodipicolinate synthase family protein [Anaerolineae bacterium]
MSRFEGVWPALVTPLTESEELNVDVTRQLVDHLIEAGIGGLYVCGGTGEGILLPPNLRKDMAQ